MRLKLLKCMLCNKKIVALFLIVLAGMVGSSCALAENLLMVFRDKPPYSYLDNGIAKGFLLERVRQVLKRAGISSELREMPPKRIFMEIEKNTQAVCSFGWYKIPEREKYALFSLPIHQDRPHAVLAGDGSLIKIRRHLHIKELMSDQTLFLVAADGVSYGSDIDAMIGAFPGKVDKTLQSPLEVARKLAAQRADFMFIDQDDYDYLIASNADFRGEGLTLIQFQDMPTGLKRYILCSKLVGEPMIRRINQAIEAMGD